MIRVRASQVFTHAVEDAVAAKKALDEGLPFVEVVEKYSTCPSKQNGGDLGWMPEDNATALLGQVSPEDQGKVLGPVHSPYGYHILKITEVEKEEEETTSFHADTPMTEVNKVLPEVHTLLFKKFHIGMPVQGYKPEETIFSVCEQQNKQVGEVLAAINAEMKNKLTPMITPQETAGKLRQGDPNLVLLDIREQWEHDIAKIDEAILINQNNCEEVLSSLEVNKEIVLIDWKGDRYASFQKFLAERGFTNTKGMEGGIDAWAETVDTKMARYEIDEEDDDYRYEDILGDPQ